MTKLTSERARELIEMLELSNEYGCMDEEERMFSQMLKNIAAGEHLVVERELWEQKTLPALRMISVDELAAIIRFVDGNHDRGAGQLAECILGVLGLSDRDIIMKPDAQAERLWVVYDWYDWFRRECAAEPDSGEVVDASVRPAFDALCDAMASTIIQDDPRLRPLPDTKTRQGHKVSNLVEYRHMGKSWYFGIIGLDDPEVGGWPCKWAENGEVLNDPFKGTGWDSRLVFEKDTDNFN